MWIMDDLSDFSGFLGSSCLLDESNHVMQCDVVRAHRVVIVCLYVTLSFLMYVYKLNSCLSGQACSM